MFDGSHINLAKKRSIKIQISPRLSYNRAATEQRKRTAVQIKTQNNENKTLV